MEPDWDTLVKENLVWEQNQLARLQEVENQSTLTQVETVVDNDKATPFVDESIKNPLTNDLIRRSDASPVPDNEREEENIKLHEVREDNFHARFRMGGEVQQCSSSTLIIMQCGLKTFALSTF